MVVLGILLALAAAGVGAGVIIENSSPASIELLGRPVPGIHTQGQVFAAGVFVALFFLLGMALTIITAGRALRRRRELRDLREEHQESLTTLELEKQQLQRELARARGSAPGGAGQRAGLVPDGPGAPGGVGGSPATEAAPVAGGRAVTDDVRVAPRRTTGRDAMSPFFDRSGR